MRIKSGWLFTDFDPQAIYAMAKNADDPRDDLGAIANVLVDQCSKMAKLRPREALVVFSAAIGITMAEGGLEWTDENWAEIGEVVKRIYDSCMEDKPQLH